MLLELSGLYRYVRHAYAAWPVVACCHRDEDGEPCHDCAGYRGRGRWLRHRLRPLRPRDAAQRRSALSGDGEPDLWTYDRPDLTYQPHRSAYGEHALREQCVAS